MMDKLSTAERLKDLRVSDMKLNLDELAEKTGLSRSALGKYESDECGDITSYALVTLAEFYDVSTDYILGLTEEKKPASSGTENQYFSQEMLDLLKSGKINRRLFSELILHKDFRRLMTDIEIAVDRHVDQHMQIIKMMMPAVRKKIMDQYAAEKENIEMKTLELADQSTEIYLSRIIHDDLDSIIRDIRENHLEDNATADKDPVPRKEQLESFIQSIINGASKTESFMHVLGWIGISKKKRSIEDAEALLRITEKSDLVRKPKRMRGKVRFFHKVKESSEDV